MSALMKNIDLSDGNSKVTSISANARIDYILRFSKQAILVIDESAQQNAQILNQVIATIPEHHNAAYVSLSAQFNDIQIRCRIIEQLSSGELFDPEVSLAVSLVNIVKKTQQGISIVLDRAQHLPLQLLHEITQLSDIAKKANLVINIIMFGSPEAGTKVKENKSLFNKKLTLLSAQSGQLLSANAAIFQHSKEKWYAIKFNKWLLLTLTFLILISTTILVLLKQDTFNFTQAIKSPKTKATILNNVLTEPQPTVFNEGVNVITLDNNAMEVNAVATAGSELNATDNNTEQHFIVSPSDLVESIDSNSLTTDITDIKKNNEAALTDLKKTNLVRVNPDNVKAEPMLSKPAQAPTTEYKAIISTSSKNFATVDNNYYLNQQEGFIIQLGVYSKLSFIDDFASAGIDFHTYKKLHEDKAVFVITSSIYIDLLSAEQALLQMPESIKVQQPWIKPIIVTHQEINTFQNTL